MKRFTKALAFAAAFLALPSMASAISITIVNSSVSNGAVLQDGETATFDLVMSLDDPAGDLFGLQASVSGYDDADISGARQRGLAFQSATVVSEAYGTAIPSFGIVDSLSNNTSGEEEWVFNALNPQAYTTTLFSGISTTAASGTGSDDVGINGGAVHGGGTDVHFQVTFEASRLNNQAPVTSTLGFDILAVRSGGQEDTSSTPFTLTVVPEPGTALLMGLGLAGLAANRRR